MKVLLRKKMSPIHLMVGDSINLTYVDARERTTIICSKGIDQTMIVDEAIIFELSKKELKALELTDAIGGLFGKAK